MDTRLWGMRPRKGVQKAREQYLAKSRVEAVRLYRTSGRSQREIGEEPGIAPGEPAPLDDLSGYLDDGKRAGLATEERQKLRRLRTANRSLQM